MVTFKTMFMYENCALLGYYSPRNNPEVCSSVLLRGGSQKSCSVHTRSNIFYVVRIWLIFETVTPQQKSRILKQHDICLQEFRKY